ncbi:MAG: hypothetical protein RL603_2047 [Pseudomonadota bacterium]|jgi:flagellar biosynthesis chaperone FliJ
MNRQAARAKRLQRIERIGDAIARASEATWLQRRSELQEQRDRLSTVAGYCGDYARRTTDIEARGTDILSLRLYRDFSGWLSTVQNDQTNAVAQAEFLADAAADEAAAKRTFARSLEQAATRAATVARQELARVEQKQLDALGRPMRSDAQQD